MDFTIPSSILYLASWLGVTGGIWALFDHAETVITPDTRSTISRWLRGLSHEQITWPASFAYIFDKTFGVRHASACFFVRSSIASMFATSLIFLFWLASYPSGFFGVAFSKSNLVWFLALLVLNIIPDYLSLLETRWILKLLRQVKSGWKVFALLLADLLLTSLLGLMLFFLIVVARNIPDFLSGQIPFWLNLTQAGTHLEGMVEGSGIPQYLIWFLSTFLTSVWIYLYLSGRLFAIVLNTLGKTINLLMPVFDIEGQPLRFIGFTSMLVISILYLLMAIVR